MFTLNQIGGIVTERAYSVTEKISGDMIGQGTLHSLLLPLVPSLFIFFPLTYN